MTKPKAMVVPLPTDLKMTTEYIPVKDLIRDERVNPRDPSLAWCKEQLDDGYNRALLSVFTASKREDSTLALLDGGNRQQLMVMAGDEQHPVQVNLFHDLTLAQEAQVADDLNDRRGWTGVRRFQVACTMGDPTALRIQALLTKGDWIVDTASGPGVIKTVQPFQRLIVIAGHMAARELKARKASEQWNAAMESGREDAFRVLETAMGVYSAAFDDKPSGYAADMMQAIALVLLRHEGMIDITRLTQHLRDESRGHRSFRSQAGAAKDAFRLGDMVNAYAFMLVKFYNVGLRIDSKAALEDWTRITR